jgi:hypothetical protein
VSSGRRRLALALLLPALALGAAGCGDDDAEETTPSVTVPAATETAPATTAAPTTTESSTTTKPPKTGGTPSYDPGKADTPENDVPPPPGSPQEAFERMCEQNPSACG